MIDCALCKLPLSERVYTLPHDDVHRCTCPRCGSFEVTGPGWKLFENHPSRRLAANRFLLSGRARNASIEGRIERFDVDDFGAAERGEIPEPTIEEKIRFILAWFSRRSTKYGEWLSTSPATDYPVGYCHDQQEWGELINALVGKGWLGQLSAPKSVNYQLTLAGHDQLKKSQSTAVTTQPTKEPDVSDLPAYFDRYKAEVAEFHQDGAFETSVFVMMRFPDRERLPSPVNDMLDAIFSTIRDELDRFGLKARRADDRTYAAHRQLWDNLCVYMLGCKYGLAVLEDRSGDELNPNVTLEYGFMRALGRDAILVKENKFSRIRADILGTIPKNFSIDADLILDDASLRAAVEDWMMELRRPALRARTPGGPRGGGTTGGMRSGGATTGARGSGDTGSVRNAGGTGGPSPSNASATERLQDEQIRACVRSLSPDLRAALLKIVMAGELPVQESGLETLRQKTGMLLLDGRIFRIQEGWRSALSRWAEREAEKELERARAAEEHKRRVRDNPPPSKTGAGPTG